MRQILLEALYATKVVREAFTRLFNRDEFGFISDNGSDDDEAWGTIWAFTFARYYAGRSNPHFVKMVQDYDRETRACFDHEELGRSGICGTLSLALIQMD